MKKPAFVPVLKASLDALPAVPVFTVDAATLGRYAGTYRATAPAITMTVTVQDNSLVAQIQGQPPARLTPTSPGIFRVQGVPATLTFNDRGGPVESLQLVQGPATIVLTRAAAEAAAASASAPSTLNATADKPPSASVAPSLNATADKPRNWPSFRGDAGSGNADGQRAVTEWDVASGRNIKWKTPIPGMANSSPIVWGNRVFVTTAISKTGDKTFRTGLYGDVKPVDDLSEHEWKIYCARQGHRENHLGADCILRPPKTRRHPKATQANSTPVTDGRRVVAAFGSIGLLIAWDMNGKEMWRATSAFSKADGSSIRRSSGGTRARPSSTATPSFCRRTCRRVRTSPHGISARASSSGRPIGADEIPTWGTPAIASARSGRHELVTNGTKIRGYDPATGKLLWTLGPNSEVTVGTPVAGHGLVFVTGGYPPVRPIYAIRPGAGGDISLPKGERIDPTPSRGAT